MCEEQLATEKSVVITEISAAIMDMPLPKGFILPDGEKGIRPQFASEITAIYLLMHWPVLNSPERPVFDEEAGLSNSGMSLYAALLPHGKKYVAEVFIASEEDQSYLGSVKAFSIEFPDNLYTEEYDEWLMDELAQGPWCWQGKSSWK